MICGTPVWGHMVEVWSSAAGLAPKWTSAPRIIPYFLRWLKKVAPSRHSTAIRPWRDGATFLSWGHILHLYEGQNDFSPSYASVQYGTTVQSYHGTR